LGEEHDKQQQTNNTQNKQTKHKTKQLAQNKLM
jgi:hypothetical protein